MTNKIGVFICHCGENIASKVDIKELTKYAETLEGVVVCQTNKYICSEAGAKMIKDAIKKYKLTAVVTASCSPRMHETTFRGIVKDAGLNQFVLEIANIREQCSWIHDDPKIATKKAKDILRGAVAKARLLEPLVPPKVKVKPEAMVIGGGIAGIQASLDLADAGHKVYLVEKTPSIGGRMAQLDKTFPTLDCSGCILTPKMKAVFAHKNIELLTYAEVTNVEGTIGNYNVTVKKKARYVQLDKCKGCGDCAEACRLHDRVVSEFDMGMGKRSAIYLPFSQAVPPKYTIDKDSCLMLTRGKCGTGPLCVDACPEKCIDFNQKDVDVSIEVGVIVVATGFDVMDTTKMHEYGYARSKDVITTMEMERLINSAGPTDGKILRPSNGKEPKSITYVLCVGSRDETECNWCCRIGCMSALKQVYLMKEKLGDDVELNVCYTDIRSFGKGYEEFYRKIRGLNVNFFRGRPSEVRNNDEELTIDIFDTTTNKLFEIKSDLVVLVPALVARKDAEEFARILRISQSSDGFLLEAHPKLRPMDTFTSGIFIAGSCQGPKDIQDTVSHASGAAARSLTILSKKEYETEPFISFVDEDLCSGCASCIAICPYDAIKLEKQKDGKSIAKVNETLCMGCGACVTACPSGAMQQRGFKDKQLIAMIDEII